MYEEYWKLKEKPFENTPDPRFIYYSKKHEEALSRMLYVVREKKGGGILTGEYGCGKTLLSRILMDELLEERYHPVLVFNPLLPSLDLIKEIAYQLGGSASNLSAKTDVLHFLNEILYKNHERNKYTVIMVDEAQTISDENGFEELRLLLNFQLNNEFLLTLILLGQPELKEKVEKLPQLRQRLSVRYHLKALTEDETGEYIRHRLEVAGLKEAIFTEKAVSEIYRFSWGRPRRINNICDMALLVGCGEGANKIQEGMIREVAEDLEEVPIDAKENSVDESNIKENSKVAANG